MSYEIQFKSSALKSFKKLDVETRGRIAEAILSLPENPIPHNARKISGRQDLYRLRVGNYRVIYEIQEDVLVILIVKIGHRRDIYKRL